MPDRSSETEPAWLDRVQRLEAEVAGLRRAMRTRGLIEQAKGILAERLGTDPEEAFGYLTRLSQNANVSVVDIAADLVSAGRLPAAAGGPAPPPRPGGWVSRAPAGLPERMEALGGLGFAQWRLDADAPAYWSPGLFTLLGRDPASGPRGLDELEHLVVPEDRDAVAVTLERAAQGRAVSIEARVPTDTGEPRHIRLTAQPSMDDTGRTVGVAALFQDVTADRHRERELSRAGEQLAAQRIQHAAEKAHTQQLRRLLYPPPELTVVDAGLRVWARHAAPASINRFRGDFYDVTRIEGGGIVLTLGDVFGSGVTAANAMVRLRHAARSLSLVGLDPARLLTLLNVELGRDAEPPLASLIVARFDHAAGTMTWAQAGHFAPILIRDGRPTPLSRPHGVALGLLPETQYRQSALALHPADLLVCYTDGVIGAADPRGDPFRLLLRGFGEAYRAGGAPAVLDRFVRPAQDEACIVAAEYRP